jgi:hypothetical protein
VQNSLLTLPVTSGLLLFVGVAEKRELPLPHADWAKP